MKWLYSLILQLSAVALLHCMLDYLLPKGGMGRSAGRALDLIQLWMMADALFSALREVI